MSRKRTPAMFCDHANEVPSSCPCAAGCYCKTRTCRPSEREQIEASRLHRPLAAATAAVNAQLQTPESWHAVWADVTQERRR